VAKHTIPLIAIAWCENHGTPWFASIHLDFGNGPCHRISKLIEDTERLRKLGEAGLLQAGPGGDLIGLSP